MVRHETVAVNGVALHVARQGFGPPLVLLHGWPEFWLTWEPVMARLADRFDCIAPDLRGFGLSAEAGTGPSDRAGPEVHADDVLALLDALGIARAGIVGHDVGAYVAQALGRRAPERCAGLFFFDCPYPGIGPRLGAPDNLIEIWYQSFHLKPFAAAMVASSREACRLYIGHFLRHWSGPNPGAFDDVLEAFVDNFLRPGAMQGGFNWYLSQQAGRLAMLKGEAPALPPITVPACIRWPEADPLFPYAWTDRLPDVFADLDLAPMPGCGHFPHREKPDAAAQEIARFFGRVMG
ncbi:alpha/beta fold hydrolase [Methylobacterium gregans]|uniref:Soluble epoxide hydrolase n=1 Tax=Methylobacterium gregans TaxID=374424 RepID=A0AA37HPJ7_9HYPH|nr:pimeloyl-ACP methyl ester carboxylesterase [Methylobacterium gregans]GJD78793.1 Soluble epoxide hydrolase [Methylobacterium gregans]GLS53630.1 alpha/beta hydrolase [Methylobacterium gregans]